MEYKINSQERDLLRGLPYLHQLIYLIALRPFMDYCTGIVGAKRGISYQSIAEALYIEPHSGYKSGSPQKNQIRRALARLAQAGLIKSQGKGKRLIFECIFASRDLCVENKVGMKPTQQVDTKQSNRMDENSESYRHQSPKASMPKVAQAGTPPVSGINFIFLQQKFEIFWVRYPQKKSKSHAWEVFCKLNPDEALFEQILQGLEQQVLFYQNQEAVGNWLPAWKYPANWLAQHCWQEEFQTEKVGGKRHVKRGINVMWESCKGGFARIQAERRGH